MAVLDLSSTFRRKWTPRGGRNLPSLNTSTAEGPQLKLPFPKGSNAEVIQNRDERSESNLEANLPFQTALSGFLNRLDENQRVELQTCSQTSIEGLFDQIEKLDEADKASSFYRKAVCKIEQYFAWLPDALGIIEPAVRASEPASIAVGLVKAILQLAFRAQASFKDLSSEINRLSNGLQTLAIYGEKCSGDPRVYEVLVDIYNDLFKFYIQAHGLFVRKEGSSRTPKFIFLNFQKCFGEILSSIENRLDQLRGLSDALKLAHAQKLDHYTEEEAQRRDHEELQRIMNHLSCKRFEDFQRELDSRAAGTCEWIIKDKAFCQWMNSDQSVILALTGNVGFGKTITTAYLVELLKGPVGSKSKSDRNLVCSFFCDDKDEIRKSAVSVFRGLLCEIIDQNCVAAEHVRNWYRCHRQNDFQSCSQLRSLLLSTLATVQTGCLFIIVDAIDECDEKSQRTLLSTFSAISAARNAAITKVIVTYRPSEKIDQQLNRRTFRLELESAANYDFQVIVRSALLSFQQARRFTDQTRIELEAVFIEKAAGCPLWVKLMLKYLDDRATSNRHKLLRLVQDLPPGLDDVYIALLAKLKPEDRAEAFQALAILAASVRPLTLSEFDEALAVSQVKYPPGSTVDMVQSKTIQDVNIFKESDFQGHILGILGSFVRIFDSRVHLVHQSAKEFILGGSSQTLQEYSRDRNITQREALLASYTCCPETANGVLAQCCIKFLNLQEFEYSNYDDKTFFEFSVFPLLSPTTASSKSLSGRAMSPDFPTPTSQQVRADIKGRENMEPFQFYEYASRYWVDHLLASSATEAASLNALMIALSKSGSIRLRNWAQPYRRRIMSETRDQFPELNQLDPLVMATYLRQPHMLDTCLKMSLLNEINGDLRVACIWAARLGRLQELKILLEHHDVYLHKVVELGELLFFAAKHGHSAVVRFLLQVAQPAQVSSVVVEGWTSLSIAVSNGFLEITDMILAISEKDLNVTMPLFCAVPIHRQGETAELAGLRKTILQKILITGKAELAYRNPRNGETVLAEVARSGCIDTLQTILDYGRSDEIRRLLDAEPDHAGRSALWYAAFWGHVNFLRLLCKQPNIENQFRIVEPEDETPLAAAAKQGYAQAVKLLAEADPSSIDRCAITVGKSPLALAACSNTGGAAVARVLLGTGKVDVESRCDDGRTPLSCAVSYANVEMIKVLVVEGKADTKEVLGFENGKPKLLQKLSFEFEEKEVLDVLISLTGDCFD